MQADTKDPTRSRVTKGERTRRRLKEAALKLLAEVGYHDLKIQDLAREAGVANGVFYIYFKDKADLVLDMMEEIAQRNVSDIFAGAASSDPFAAVLDANRRYVQQFADGGGLNRAIGQIVDTIPEARLRWQAVNAAVARKIAAGIARRAPASLPHEGARVFAALALQAMLDTVLLQTYAYEFPELAPMAANPERLAQALSILWHRALHGVDPRPEQVPEAQDFLTFPLAPSKA
jgi:AcrR family transcriptional regulator